MTRAGVAVLVALAAAAAQGISPRAALDVRGVHAAALRQDSDYTIDNAPYDGRFTFARIRFDPSEGFGGGRSFWGRRDLKWDHDFPRAERNFMRILTEVSTLRPYMDGGNVLAVDDPELFKYPLAYLCEPGYWTPSDEEAAALRAYLAKGGFLIFDDFFGSHWYTFEKSMQKVLPGARLVELDVSHPIFDSFYRIESLDFGATGPGGSPRGRPQFFGIFEDNDPDKRLIAVANYNNDIGDYWEWSDAGFVPIQISNEAYKLGVNYVIYAMTH